MEIILKKKVDALGDAHTLVHVKPGYARNYLIPKGLAVAASKEEKEKLAKEIEEAAQKREALIAEYKQIAETLKSKAVTVGVKVGTTDKIFGSVTTHHLAESIKNQLGVDVDRRALHIKADEIKTLGSYDAKIILHEEVSVTINFKVVAE